MDENFESVIENMPDYEDNEEKLEMDELMTLVNAMFTGEKLYVSDVITDIVEY